MHLAAIRRYPVKSMAGEELAEATIREDGVAGDRVVHVRGADGRVVTSRTHPRLLAHKGTLDDDGEPLVDGRPWRDPRVAEDVRRAAGDGSILVRNDGLDRFDMLPLLVATDGAIAAFGRDGRRLRPNLVLGSVDGLQERAWEGKRLRIGAVVVVLRALRQRCVMTTYDPDTQAQDHDVLKDIVRRFGGTLCLDTEVVEPGRVKVGDPVVLEDAP